MPGPAADPTTREGGRQPWRVGHRLAAVPFALGLLLLPAFLTGVLDPGLSAPVYILLVSGTVLVGWPGIEDGHPAVPATAAVMLGAAALWTWRNGLAGLPSLGSLLEAWRLTPAGGGLPAWWPLILAVPAFLVVLVEAIRGGRGFPADTGTRGALEGLPGRTDLFGLGAFGLGVAGTLFAGSTFLEKVAVVAPIFEEYAKLGLALLVLAALGVSSSPAAYALGALSGLAFGVLEHSVTYSAEAQGMYLVRASFHALAAGLSALVYVQLRRREDLAPGVGWFAIAPAALVHAANNVMAILVAIGRAMRAVPVSPLMEVMSLVFVASLVAATVWVGLRPGRAVEAIEGWWHRLNGEIDRPRILPVRD